MPHPDRMLELEVPETGAGARLDLWLAKARIGLSRNRLQKLIDDGRVLVNGRAGKSSLKLKVGDKLAVTVPPRRQGRVLAESAPLTVVYEDAALLVLDKPAGIVVHPGAGVQSGTLVNALLHHAPELATVGGEGRPGIVHRLDRDTSGLLVVARTEEAYLALTSALRDRLVKRVYHAIVWGDPGPSEGIIDLPVGRDPKDRKRMAVIRGPGGKLARTRWRVLERYGMATLIEAKLETGRTHQIRVHMSALKHPCVGDVTYGADPTLSKRLGLQRQWLHAVRLSFAHPDDGRWVSYESAYAPDLQRALDRVAASS